MAPSAATPAPGSAACSQGRAVVGPLTLVVLLVLARALRLDALLATASERAQYAGVWGLVAMGLLYVPTALAGFPCALLTLAAGCAFGPAPAAAVAILGNTAGACSAFGAGRAIAGEALRPGLGDGRLASALRNLEGEKAGFWAVFLLRLSPITPFAILNHAFALTPIRLPEFALATLLGSMPSAVLFAVLGAIMGGPFQPGPW